MLWYISCHNLHLAFTVFCHVAQREGRTLYHVAHEWAEIVPPEELTLT